jgi:ribose transport system permease protein
VSSVKEHRANPDEEQAAPEEAREVGRYAPVARRLWKSSRHLIPVTVLLVAIVIMFSVSTPYFLTRSNLIILLTSNTALWVVAIGMTAVMVSGAVDLSVGALVAFLSILFAKLLGVHVPGVLALLVTVVAGALIGGLVNGLLIGRLRLSFLLVTLASLTAFTGFVNLWSDTKSIPVNSSVTDRIAFGDILGVNTSILIMVVVFVVALFVQTRTYFGRDVYAVGGNRVAARLAGTISVFAISGGAAALAAIVEIGRTSAASPTVDNSLPLQAIACVLLGGAAISGGSGGVGGTALGALFLSTLGNGLSLTSLSSYWQGVVTGVILVGAVLLNRLSEGSLPKFLRRRRHDLASTGSPGPGS